MAQRIVLAFVALVAAAWLAVAFRDARLQASGLELAKLPVERLDAATVRESDDRLRRARLLNPDRTLAYDRGALLLRTGRQAEGVQRIERYLREEPDNRDAWGILSAATSRTQPELSRRALRRFRQLGSTAAR
jgi:hypothetical protein